MTDLGQIFLQNAPKWWIPQNGELFNVYSNFRKIASCSFAFIDQQISPRGKTQYFPDSWFLHTSSDKMKSVMEIIGLETIGSKGNGYGRTVLQALYRKSKMRGCAGRMQVMTAFGSAPFYEHCGFKGKNTKKDELKYFDPTEENLKLLFSKETSSNRIKFIPIQIATDKIENKLWLKRLSQSTRD